MIVWVTLWTHKHGEDLAVFATEDLAETHRQQVAAEQWDIEFSEEPKPEDPKELADEYFELMEEVGGEYWQVFKEEVYGYE